MSDRDGSDDAGSTPDPSPSEGIGEAAGSAGDGEEVYPGGGGGQAGGRTDPPQEFEIRLRLQVVPGAEGQTLPLRLKWAMDSPEGGGVGAPRVIVEEEPAVPAADALSTQASSRMQRMQNAVLAAGIVAVLAVAGFVGASLLSDWLRPEFVASADTRGPASPIAGARAGGATDTLGEGNGTPPADAVDPAFAEPAQIRILGQLPRGTRVLLNGEEVGRTTFSLPPGRHVVAVAADGYETAALNVDLRGGQTQVWTPRLRRLVEPVRQAAPARIAAAPDGRGRARPAESADAPPARVAAEEPPPALPAAQSPAPETPPQEPAPILAAAGEPAAEEAPADPAAGRAMAIAEIRDILSGFAQALESRRIAEVRDVYPAVPSDEQSRWREFFESDDVSDLRVSLATMQMPMVRGNVAEATFDIVLQFNSTFAGQTRQPARYRAVFAKDARGWTMRSMQAVN